MPSQLTETPPRGAGALDVGALLGATPLYDAVIDELHGRRIRIGDRWLADFASCNYLGFDLDPEIMDAIAPAVRAWGTHPSWSRMLGSPRLYPDLEEELTDLLGAPDSLLLPNISLIHVSVIPALVRSGSLFLDSQAHRTIYDGCVMARARGASLHRFPSGDLEALRRLLTAAPTGTPRVVCMDGVNSMTGNAPDLPAAAALAREFGALLYVDDAHGFGVIGEQPDASTPYGWRGNSVVRHAGESYDGIVLVGGFSKAYSSLLAFVALPTAVKNELKVAAAPYLYSGPSPVASLATVQAGFRVNAARGDQLRADLHRKTARVLACIDEVGLTTPNRSGLPIIEIPIAETDDVQAVGRYLFDAGIYVTLAAYPLVPRSQVGFRIQVTAANSDEEITELCDTLRGLAVAFGGR